MGLKKEIELIQSLKWRYAVKHFDASKKIPAETWKALEESLETKDELEKPASVEDYGVAKDELQKRIEEEKEMDIIDRQQEQPPDHQDI